MRALALVLVAACATAAPPLPADHPASPHAPVGRLAGAPAALRPGVVRYGDVPALRTGPPAMPMHHHHQP
ncbi:MAG: hypothetical protein ACM31C_03020 [Acidobacteriota bacterium]